MEITFAKCETILKTLPIGFYAGRRIETTLDKKEDTSFYSPMEDKIVVSYPIIAHRFEAMPETSTCTDEEAVRSMLYHEVSHAILTPAKAIKCSAMMNIFEDERIETVLRDFYHGVDFQKQLYDIHGGNAPKATDTETAFFNAVRFGLGTPEVQAEIERVLDKYASLNRASVRYSCGPCGVDYEYDVKKIWDMIDKDFPKNSESYQPQDGEGSPVPQNSMQPGEGGGEGDEEGNETTTDSESESNKETTSPKTAHKGKPHKGKMSAKEIKKTIENAFADNLEKTQIKAIADFQKAAETIIGNFNKKNKNGSGINAYSGVFNPRAVVRKDYRFFDRSMSTQGNNKFGTCHLNLIIDCSGSFWNNVKLTNGILAALSEIERKNRNFSMDVAFINDSFHLCESVRERKMTADGGNDIPHDMKEILMKLQKPNTCNYNIVLFDGDALSDGGGGGNYCKRFGVFDMKQTTLITDPENQRYMKPAFSAAKVVITNKYTKELIDNILKALTVAFG